MAQDYNSIHNTIELVSNIELGLGWLHAVAQGYIYGYNKIESGSNLQRNLTSVGIH